MPVALYTDVHIPGAITEQLRLRGVDVLSANEEGTNRLRDDELLTTASALRNITYGTADQLPRVSQELRLRCSRCGTCAVYDVGTIFSDVDVEGNSLNQQYAFTGYFRCHKCASAGPWEIDDSRKLSKLALRAKADSNFEGFRAGRCTLFDGTFIQTPAMGEEHLLGLLEDEPQNAFLCTRLGNLFRGCDDKTKASECRLKSWKVVGAFRIRWPEARPHPR